MKLTFFLSLYLFLFKVPFFSVCHWNNKNKTADTSTLLNLFFIRWHDWLCVTFLHQINTDYRSEFARCLEPLLLLGPRCPPSVSGSSVATRWDHLSECLKVLFLHRRSPPEHHHAIIRILPNESKKEKKKSLGRKFHTCKGSKLKIPKWFASTDGRQRWLQYEERRRRAESHYGSYSVCTVSSEHWYVYVTHLVAWGAGKEAVDPVFRKLCLCCGPGQEHSR